MLWLGCQWVMGAISKLDLHRCPSGWLCLQADDLDGEIDLRSCTDVTEFAVQRNYGFQIHVSVQHYVDTEQQHQGALGGNAYSLSVPRGKLCKPLPGQLPGNPGW